MNQANDFVNPKRRMLLDLYIRDNNLNRFKDIISKSKTFDVNEQDEFGYTFLMMATGMNRRSFCEYLLDLGADMNLINSRGETCLALAHTLGLGDLIYLFKGYKNE